jgi:hypothetical protein
VHADLALVDAALQSSERDALELAAPLTSEQFHWQPDGGRAWSVAHCLDHLALAGLTYIGAMNAAVERALARGAPPRHDPLRPGWFGRWFIRQMEPPPKRRLKAPGKIVPSAKGTKAEIIKRFIESQHTLRHHLAEWDDLDLNRIRFQNPYVPVLRYQVGAGFLILAAHNRRHVWQARRVVEACDFPRRAQAR